MSNYSTIKIGTTNGPRKRTDLISVVAQNIWISGMTVPLKQKFSVSPFVLCYYGEMYAMHSAGSALRDGSTKNSLLI